MLACWPIFPLLPTGKGPGVVMDPFERNLSCWTAYGVDRPSIKNGLEILQGAGFFDASWEFIPIPVVVERKNELKRTSQLILLEEPSLASGSAMTWF